MIFAAGLGTRLAEETTNKPKALVKVGNKTLLQRGIEKLADSGISEVVINVHHFPGMIKEFLSENDFGIPVYISDESEKLLDTGGGLKKARFYLSDSSPILIYNVDILSDIDLSTVIRYHQKSKALATLVVRKRETNRYLKFNDDKRLVGWVNKKTGETKIAHPDYFDRGVEKAFSGIHIVNSEIFRYMPEEDKFSIIDLYLKLAENHMVKGYFDESVFWMDVGKPDQLYAARQLFSD